MDKFFVTTPIFYVNDVPHIGHTYTTVAADVLARSYKQAGYNSKLLTGTDEHGAKIAEAAKKHNQKPKEYADQISEQFKKTWQSLDIDYSRFLRTTDPDHIKTAGEFLQKLFDVGAIDPQPRLYTGLYCIGHEKFMSEDELVDGLCPEHKTKPVMHSEENYYFKLSKFQDQLIDLIKNDSLKIKPPNRKREILGKLELGLEDISISRANLEWGIPLPFDKTHTAYVWIEALINYYTFGKPNNLWSADVHLIGKDILWFHAVIWPAMLLAIGEKTPKTIFAHGFFTIEGQKMSKTIGNVIKPAELIKKYGVDGTRYVTLAAFPFGEDGDFSWELLDRLYNADLANGLGNLVARVAKLCQKVNFNPDKNGASKMSFDVWLNIQNLDFFQSINLIRNQIAKIDAQINQEQPWKLPEEKLTTTSSDYVSGIKQIAVNLKPFLPNTAKKILEDFPLTINSPLFPRLSSS